MACQDMISGVQFIFVITFYSPNCFVQEIAIKYGCHLPNARLFTTYCRGFTLPFLIAERQAGKP